MYCGSSDLSKLLNENATTLTLHHLSPDEAQADDTSHTRSPRLSAYLTLLNNLAQHDLNFQNLLVLYNLVNLGLDFSEDKRPSDLQRSRPEPKPNCLAEFMQNFGKQQIPRGHPNTRHNIIRNNHPTSFTARGFCLPQQQIMDNNRRHGAQRRSTCPELVVGYPPFDHPQQHNLSTERHVPHGFPPSNVVWSLPMNVCGQEHHYHQDDRILQQWNQWSRDDRFVQGMDAVLLDTTHSGHDVDFQERIPPLDEFHTPDMEREVVDVNDSSNDGNASSLHRCTSWPDSMRVSSAEGMGHYTEQSSDTTTHRLDGFHETDINVFPEQYLQISRHSDLERFIERATPAIPLHTFDDSATDPYFSLTMENIWEFYEIPCVYGLQVPFSKGGKSVSFAHFVPSLSAIRLFATASPTNEHASQEDLFLCDVAEYPQPMHLLFDFSETSKPHVRRPLVEEIQHLSHSGESGKVLPNLPLSEIHPASWFSVAWYPIYCIPEGKLRTSFLTFHSFGSSSTIVYNPSGVETLFKAPLIGLMFMALSQGAWMRPTITTPSEKCLSHRLDAPLSIPNAMIRMDTWSPDVKSLMKHLHAPRYKQGLEPCSEHKRPLNGFDGMDDRDDQLTYTMPTDLEEEVNLLQRNAERLARSSFRRASSSSGKSDSARVASCHSDFEFFHQRS